MKKSVCFLSMLILFLSVGISASAQNAPQTQKPDAQSQPAPQPDAQQPQSKPAQPPDQAAPPATDAASAQSPQSAGGQTFTGTIVKSGDKYTFQEEATGKTYDIDHQNEVQKFEGKKVKVHGTLDASANMIHVQ